VCTQTTSPDIQTGLIIEQQRHFNKLRRDTERRETCCFQEWSPPVENGTSTTWSRLPTEMAIELTAGHDMKMYVEASISRVQHNTADTNTAYRIVLDPATSKERQLTLHNTGNHCGWAFSNMRMSAIFEVTTGFHVLQVQYKTQRGEEAWYSDENGDQFRQLHCFEL